MGILLGHFPVFSPRLTALPAGEMIGGGGGGGSDLVWWVVFPVHLQLKQQQSTERMHAFSVSVHFRSSSYPCSLFSPHSFTTSNTNTTGLTLLPCKIRSFTCQPSSANCLPSQFRAGHRVSNVNDDFYGDEEDVVGGGSDGDGDDEEANSLSGDGVFIELKKLGKNSRRIQANIGINASLDIVWSILTDYERLADFIPGLAVSKLIEKKDNFARLYQIGQQDLLFGLKFNAKAILDCYERELETFGFGIKRDIEFKMTEGDFQFFEGKWSIEQFNKPTSESNDFLLEQEFETTLSYFLEVKPKLWLPVQLIEGRVCKEIKTNLSCIREEAQKLIQNTLQAQ